MDWSSLLALKFEFSLTLIIFVLLFLKIAGTVKNTTLIIITNVLLLANVVVGVFSDNQAVLFGGMFRNCALFALEKSVLSLGVLIISLTAYEWMKKHKHLAEFYILMLSSLLGMFFMISSGNLLMFYLGLELSTIPLAALCNFDLEKKISSEAAVKMILSSAFSSGIMLFGISLLYGTTGTLQFDEMALQITGTVLQKAAFIILLTGFAFKLSVVPFHLWTADVYEGSPVAVTAFLSVISKGAMAFVLLTVLNTAFNRLMPTAYYALSVLALITIVTGNLFALRQTNLKRFLAFSSISQVGYILIAIANLGNSEVVSIAAVVYFILIYMFSNLAAFGVIAVISSLTGRETINDYKGLYFTNPGLALVLTVALFSLAGIPPTAGFFGKLFLLTSAAVGSNWIVVIIAALNLVVSLFYYLRIVRLMFVDKNEEPIAKLKYALSVNLSLVVCLAGILAIGFSGGIFDKMIGLSLGFFQFVAGAPFLSHL